jgi:hypothetical protein
VRPREQPSASFDRQAIVDVVVLYATDVDLRDWRLYEASFTDPCVRLLGVEPAAGHDDATRGMTKKVCSVNGNFETTQHLSTNHVVTFQTDDSATCVSYMQAQHWFSAQRLAELGHPSDTQRWGTLGGSYTNSVVRTDDGWRIRRCQLDVTWVTGDASIFEIARSVGDRG